MFGSVRDYVVNSDRIRSLLKNNPAHKADSTKYLLRIRTQVNENF